MHKTYRFENCISTINGKTLDEVAKSTGWFIEWVCHVKGTNFEWDFGRNEYEYLYLGLEEYEDMGKQIFPKERLLRQDAIATRSQRLELETPTGPLRPHQGCLRLLV